MNHSKNYQLYFIQNVDAEPAITKIDNLLDWMLKEKVVPYSDKNRMVHKDSVVMMMK